MKSNQSTRQFAGIAIVVVISLIVNLKLLLNLMHHTDLNAVGADAISLYEKKFKDMESKLPSKDIVGYIDDRFGRMDDAKIASLSAELIARYYLTQYALAPHLIENSIKHRFVIGNFMNYSYSKEVIPSGATVRMDFGGGLVLIEGLPE
jgi:hypothetical protein